MRPFLQDNEDLLARAIARCESEPIRFAGAIQGHGVLLAFDADWRLSVAGGDLRALAGLSAEEALGRDLAEILGERAAGDVLAAAGGPPVLLPRLLRLASPRPLLARLHRSGPFVVLELDAEGGEVSPFVEGQETLPALLRQLETSQDIRDCCQVLARKVRWLSGFDRVLVYRFDAEWNGEVVAESGAGVLPSLLGHHFPAGDIPPQARALYEVNTVRLLVDRAAEPAPLAGAPGHALDMSDCVFRSMSPVHLEYLRNMGVRASMSISITYHGRLWGLIACHHASARRLDFLQLDLAEVVGRVASMKISSLEDGRRAAAMERIRRVLLALARLFGQEDDLAALSRLLESDILEIVGASGCLLLTQDGQFSAGQVPAGDDVRALTAWLRDGPLRSTRTYACRELGAVWPRGAGLAAVAAGVLAIQLAPERGITMLWFRRERTGEIAWAGQPEKRVVADAAGPRLEPRRSFGLWLESAGGKSRHWESFEVDAANTIGHALHAVITERRLWYAEHELRLAAESASQIKSQFLSNISHELRTPLHAILGFSSKSLRDREGVSADKLCSYLEFIAVSAARLDGLLVELLDLAELQAGQVRAFLQPVNLQLVLAECVRQMQAADPARPLGFDLLVETDVAMVQADPSLLKRLFHHVLDNAAKHTPPGSTVEVVLRPVEASGSHGPAWPEVAVLDRGQGIPPDELEYIFRPFTQSTRTDRGQGGRGLGLAICRSIMALHGGDIRAANRPGGGTVLSCTFPPSC